MSANNLPTARTRLDSWKEIAAFFGRDERTVNRWEKERGLPVHRLPGTKGRIYAFSDELSAWLAAPRNAGAGLPDTELPDDEPGSQPAMGASGFTVIPGQRESARGKREASVAAGTARATSAWRYRDVLRLLGAAVLGVGATALFLFHPSVGRTPRTIGTSTSLPRRTASAAVVLASTPAHDPEAEQLYLKGRFYWNKRTPDDLNRALDYFTQAVVHDPNYSQAYVGMADCYNLMREYTLMPSSEAYTRALAAAKKAVELDEQSSEAHASLAFVSFFGMWDVAAGEREFRRAIDLNPNNPAPHQWYANALLALQRLPEAVAEIDHAQALDPASNAILADKGNILFRAGRTDEGFALLKQMESREPAFRSPHVYLKGVYLKSQDYPNYISELRRDALLVHDDSALAVAAAAEKGFAAGGARGMFEAMLKVQKKLYAQQLLPPTPLAQTSALQGNKNEALRYLNDAYQQRDGTLLFVETYPEFRSLLHEEPAYRHLLTRMNLPPQNAP